MADNLIMTERIHVCGFEHILTCVFFLNVYNLLQLLDCVMLYISFSCSPPFAPFSGAHRKLGARHGERLCPISGQQERPAGHLPIGCGCQIPDSSSEGWLSKTYPLGPLVALDD